MAPDGVTPPLDMTPSHVRQYSRKAALGKRATNRVRVCSALPVAVPRFNEAWLHAPFFVLLAKDTPQRIADLAERGVGFDRCQDARHQIG
jgi:hypothetical protein